MKRQHIYPFNQMNTLRLGVTNTKLHSSICAQNSLDNYIKEKKTHNRIINRNVICMANTVCSAQGTGAGICVHMGHGVINQITNRLYTGIDGNFNVIESIKKLHGLPDSTCHQESEERPQASRQSSILHYPSLSRFCILTTVLEKSGKQTSEESSKLKELSTQATTDQQ